MFPPVLLFFFKVTYSKQLQHTFGEKSALVRNRLPPSNMGAWLTPAWHKVLVSVGCFLQEWSQLREGVVEWSSLASQLEGQRHAMFSAPVCAI